jgi:hypothetical protein
MRTKKLKSMVDIFKEYNTELEIDIQGRLKPTEEERWLYPVDHIMLGEYVEETVNIPEWLVER